MMNVVQHRYFNITLHVLAWSIVLFLPYLISSAGIGPLPGLYFPLSGVIHIIIFYTNTLFLYPRFLNRTHWWLYIISVILLIFFSVKVKSYMLAAWFPDASPDARSHILFPSVLVFIVSIFYNVTIDKVRAEKLQLDMELKLLRSQINPHFLFNILTSLVSMARKKSDQLEPSLLMLSGLMRYTLYNAGKTISLQQEVEYLESYVALQKLRFERDAKIMFNIELLENDYHIEPMLLVPFIENAFKHGEPFIEIHLMVKDGILVFQVKNKFDTDTSKDESSGIGLNNVRSRLSLLYPGRHNLVINSDNSLFNVHLTIKLL
jgi:two-component system, LytTR family, sensor kinase